jgi:hypothetical protein
MRGRVLACGPRSGQQLDNNNPTQALLPQAPGAFELGSRPSIARQSNEMRRCLRPRHGSGRWSQFMSIALANALQYSSFAHMASAAS